MSEEKPKDDLSSFFQTVNTQKKGKKKKKKTATQEPE
jgi:hypothetical protein